MSNPPPSKTQELIIPDYISEHVITEILIRLPVKSLLQYKSVSKSWYSLISSPNFIKSQLQVAANQNLIIHNCDYENDDYNSASLVNLHSCQIVDQFDYMPVYKIIASANGIVCVCTSYGCIYLWNPATKQYRIIHRHDVDDDDDDDDVDFEWRVGEAIGFGFDPIHDDLKVVASALWHSPAIAVYSVNRNVWRKVPSNHTEFPYNRTFDVSVNGFLLSIGLSGMMAFDLNNEVLNCAINLPVTTFNFTVADFKMYDAQAYITEFNASIAVIISKKLDESAVINLWALDDEACLRGGGIEASWTLMLNIDVSLTVQVVQAYFNTGHILLLVEDVWILYDPCTKEYRIFPYQFRSGQIFKCKESLVTIVGSKQVNMNPPDDMITRILLRLPVISLLRCKSVSKSWLSHISSPNFVKSHLEVTKTRGPDQIHIVHSYEYDDEDDTSILLVNLDNRQTAYLNFPFSRNEFPCMPQFVLVGSACGIVCVRATFSNVSRIYLWNPATKLSKRIPSHNISNEDIESVVLGFGSEPTSNDFKVVRMVSPYFSAEVYSANNNAWRNVEPNPIDFPNSDNFDVCVNGFLFAAGRYGVIAFDLKTEVFNCAIKFPAPTFDDGITEYNGLNPDVRITEFKDFIAVIIYTRNIYDCMIELWALDDDACLRGRGIQASWTPIHNIYVRQPVQFIHGYFKGGDFLVLIDGVWYMYNPCNEEDDLCFSVNEKARYFKDALYTGQIFRYTKSLFDIAGSKQVRWNAYEDDNEDDN